MSFKYSFSAVFQKRFTGHVEHRTDQQRCPIGLLGAGLYYNSRNYRWTPMHQRSPRGRSTTTSFYLRLLPPPSCTEKQC